MATLIAGEDLTNNVLVNEPRASYTAITSSTLIKNSAGRLKGIMVGSVTSPTLAVWDGGTNSGTSIIGTFTPGSSTFYNFGAISTLNGIYVAIGGTCQCTILWS